MSRSSLSACVAAVLVFGASSASADSLSLDFIFKPPVSISITDAAILFSAQPEQAGEFSGLLNGAPITTFCAELTESFVPGALYTDYSVISAAAAGWSPAKSLALDHAMSYYLGSHAPTDATSSAQAQAVIWELLYETGPSYGLTTGAFQVTGVSDAAFATILAAPITVHVSELHSDGHQDFLVTTPVPEPKTYALMLAGLVSIGVFARHRSKKP